MRGLRLTLSIHFIHSVLLLLVSAISALLVNIVSLAGVVITARGPASQHLC